MQVDFNETNDGFRAKFDNGWTMSVQWKSGNYASKHTQEIAAWDEDDNYWWDFDAKKRVKSGTYVKGWVNSDELAGYLTEVSRINSYRPFRWVERLFQSRR